MSAFNRVRPNRRQFLRTSATVLGGAAVGNTIWARSLSATEMRGHTPLSAAPETIAPDTLRVLARAALEEATANGASYADVRVAFRHSYRLYVDIQDFPAGAEMTVNFEGGVRTLVNGAFAFEYVNVPMIDPFRAATRNAISNARGFAKLSSQPIQLAPVPVVRGEWATPYEIDPFAVPFVEQANLASTFGRSVKNRMTFAEGSAMMGWERETRICATTEGTITTQTFLRAQGGGWARVQGMSDFHASLFPRGRSGGLELFTGAAAQERLKAAAEEVFPYTQYPTVTMDVGRYPMVFDGEATAGLFGRTLVPALQLDRILGFEANASGTSFLSPVENVLGKELFSPLLNATAGNVPEWWTGVKWDNEGVIPPTVPLVQKGRVTNCLADRQTAPMIQEWQSRNGLPAYVGGYSYAETADRPPTVGNGHLTVDAGERTATVADFIRDMKHGVLVIGNVNVGTDQQLASGLLGARMLEIQRGKIIGYIKGSMVQLRTVPLLKGIAAIGDASTHDTAIVTGIRKGEPAQSLGGTVTAPAILCPAVDLISLSGR
jgi:TldD protein